jgi:nitrogen-specific signal transduction histidine kinase
VRLRVALDDLAAARRGHRARARPEPQDVKGLAFAIAGGVGRQLSTEWDAGMPPVVADRARLAQALGNVLANADEHGDGPVELRGRRVPGAVRLEVRNRAGVRRKSAKGRGRGLRIARSAVGGAGGTLDFRSDADRVVAAIELPVAEDEPPADAA